MEKKWELCFCRDQTGQFRLAKVPAGIAKPGMLVRLVGGIFLQVEAVENMGELREAVPIYTAAELLQPVWGRRGCV